MKTNAKFLNDVQRLPDLYEDAAAYSVMPVCQQRNRLGVSFKMENGNIFRFAIDSRCVNFLIQSLNDYKKEFEPEIKQSSGF